MHLGMWKWLDQQQETWKKNKEIYQENVNRKRTKVGNNLEINRKAI